MRQKGKAEGTITGTEVINCQRKVYKLYIQSIYWSCTDQLLLCSAAYSHDMVAEAVDH
jgi:hypothetical protein